MTSISKDIYNIIYFCSIHSPSSSVVSILCFIPAIVFQGCNPSSSHFRNWLWCLFLKYQCSFFPLYVLALWRDCGYSWYVFEKHNCNISTSIHWAFVKSHNQPRVILPTYNLHHNGFIELITKINVYPLDKLSLYISVNAAHCDNYVSLLSD